MLTNQDHRKTKPPRTRLHGETAAHHLVDAALVGLVTDTIADAAARLKSAKATQSTNVYVLDGHGRLVGVMPVATLLRHRGDQRLGDVMLASPPAVASETDQEHVASHGLHHELGEVPVVDGGGRFVGVVPPQALLHILRREHVEDLHRMAGIQREATHARRALEAPPMRRARDRLPWLLVGLMGSMIATAIVDGFAATLQARVAVAFFMPGLVYLTDAIGTQSEAIMVRGLSTTRASAGRLFRGELITGLLLGGALGSLAFLGVLLAYHNVALALAVGGTIVAGGLTACGVGVGLPWLLARAGKDPAYGSGPLGTIVQDVLTLLVYFLIVGWLL
jgi:magnesium transporter